MSNRFFLAAITGAIIAFLGGWLIFGIIFKNYYSSHINEIARVIVREEPKVVAIAISNIAWALLLTFVLQRTGSTNFAKGFIMSLWVSFLIALIFDFSVYAFWNIYEIKFLVMDLVITS